MPRALSRDDLLGNSPSVVADREFSQDGYQTIKHVYRSISKTGMETMDGAEPLEVVESYINSLLIQGWRIVSVHPLGENPSAFIMLWVLMR